MAALCAVGYLGNVWWAQGVPVRTAQSAIEMARTGNWDGLYKIGLTEEISTNGWNQLAFGNLATGLTKHLAPHELTGRMVEVSPTSSGGAPQWKVRNERHFQWILPVPNGMSNSDETIVNLVAFRTQNGEWQIAVGDMVRDMNRGKRKNVNEVIVSLKQAMEASGLKRYVDYSSGEVMSLVRLERVIKGEIKWTEIWQSRWDYDQGQA